jgi:hypothetical protein
MRKIDELGNVTETDEKPRDPLYLESIRENFARIDEQLAYLGFHWERLAVSSIGHSGKELPDEDYYESRIASRIYVHIAMGVLDGRKPSKEQVLILDYYARQCANALSAFQRDGTLPTEELKKYFEKDSKQNDSTL